MAIPGIPESVRLSQATILGSLGKVLGVKRDFLAPRTCHATQVPVMG